MIKKPNRKTGNDTSFTFMIETCAQVFFFVLPLYSMVVRGFFYRSFDIVRGLILIYLDFTSSTVRKGKNKVVPTQQPNDKTSSVHKLLRYTETLCVHARGQMQALPGFIRLYEHGAGSSSDFTFVFISDVAFHFCFYLAYLVTMHLTPAQQQKYKGQVTKILQLFQISDLTFSVAYFLHYFQLFVSMLQVLLPSLLGLISLYQQGDTGHNVDDSALWREKVNDGRQMHADWKFLTSLISIASTPTLATSWWSTISKDEKQLLLLSLVGQYVTCVDFYASIKAEKLPVILRNVIRIQSALFYTWNSFF